MARSTRHRRILAAVNSSRTTDTFLLGVFNMPLNFEKLQPAISRVNIGPVLLGSKAHRKYVMKLYRRSLRLVNDWFWQRPMQREKSILVRELFDSNKSVSSPQEVQYLLKKAEFALAYYYHPYPYNAAAAPGGAKWERNLPVPQRILEEGVRIYNP